MKILIISFHYYPDLCAGSFRTTALVSQLRQQASSDLEIEVITTAPNRYATYHVAAPALEQSQGLTIRRISLPGHRSGMLDQALAFAYFAKEVNKLVKRQNYALVYATSSRLMAATLGAWVAYRRKAPLYLDIRDIFVDTIQDVFSPMLSMMTKPIFSSLEKWTFRSAQRINLVSKGFHPYFNRRYPKIKLSWHTNGIDSDFIGVKKNHAPVENHLLTILYAGNIGEGQGLHRIIPELAKRLEGVAQFIVIGDGGRRAHLESAIRQAECTNVTLKAPIDRAELIKAYQSADVLFLHLNDHDAFRKVLPSKLFEYAAMGKPIWAGVSGFSCEFIQSEISNAAVFYPCNAAQAMDVFSTLIFKIQDRADFVETYKRDKIMKTMASEILSIV